MMREIKAAEVKDGMVIWNQGKQFRASNVQFVTATNGKQVLRYTGTCTDHKCNDDIRHSGYDGGTYGLNSDLFVTIEHP